MKPPKWFDPLVYDMIVGMHSAANADISMRSGRWLADIYAIWRDKLDIAGCDSYHALVVRHRGEFMLWRAGGGGDVPYVYGFGYWCGKDGDLLCFRPCSDEEAEFCLSPLHENIAISLIDSLSKRIAHWLARFSQTSARGTVNK